MILTQYDLSPENGVWLRLPVSLFLFFSSYTFFVWTMNWRLAVLLMKEGSSDLVLRPLFFCFGIGNSSGNLRCRSVVELKSKAHWRRFYLPHRRQVPNRASPLFLCCVLWHFAGGYWWLQVRGSVVGWSSRPRGSRSSKTIMVIRYPVRQSTGTRETSWVVRRELSRREWNSLPPARDNRQKNEKFQAQRARYAPLCVCGGT